MLPGVTVEASGPALIEGSRTAVTDNQGAYASSICGQAYAPLSFTLSGFSTLRREGLDLPAEFTATVNGELTVGSLEGDDYRFWRGSDGRSPELAGPGAVRAGDLQSLPGTRPPRHAVGHHSRGDVAARERPRRRRTERPHPDRLQRPRRSEAQPVVDGMNHQVASLTSGVFVYNQINIQEVVVETSGVGADRDTGGMQLNMIAKDGGNTFAGISPTSARAWR